MWNTLYILLRLIYLKGLLVVQNFKIVFNSVGAIISTLWKMASLKKTILDRTLSSSSLHESTLKGRKTKMQLYILRLTTLTVRLTTLSFQCSQPRYIFHCILVFLHSSVDSWRELDENVRSKTTFFKATHFSKSENDTGSSNAIKSYLLISSFFFQNSYDDSQKHFMMSRYYSTSYFVVLLYFDMCK